MKTQEYDLIIVGLGPVGLFASNVFGKRGWKVLAIEQYEERWPYPRAIGMDDEILRALRSIGLQERAQDRMRHIKGGHLLHGDYEVFYQTDLITNNTLLPRQVLYYQPEFESILEEGCGRFNNVELKYGYQLIDIKQESKDAVISKIKTIKGEEIRIKSKYLIASDGAKSFVCQHLGIQEKSFNYEGYILKIDAHAKDLSKFDYDIDYFHKYCSPKKAWIRMIGRDNHCRWEFQFKGNIEDPNDLTDEAALQHIAETGDDISNLEIINVAFYKYRSVIQKEWQKGRCFLAGDAAHLTPPYAGQGLCGGIRDIMNLAWKLEEVENNEKPMGLLTSYRKERAPHFSRFIFIAMFIGYFFKTRLYYFLLLFSKLPFVRTKGGEIYIPVPKVGKGFFSGHKLARSLVPFSKIQPQGKSAGLVDDHISHSWTLLSRQALDESIKSEISNSKLQNLDISIRNEKNKWMQNWMKSRNVKHLLIRPDLYIYSAGNNPTKLLNEYSAMTLQLA